MNKKTLTILIALVLLVAVLAGGYFATRRYATAGEKSFTLVVVHSDGTTKELSLKTDAEYLGQFLQDEGIITGTEGQYGLYIQSVDGEKAVYEEDNAYWAFYEGEAYAQLGIDLTPITDGVTYQLIYTPA